jgi:hypothetical protein
VLKEKTIPITAYRFVCYFLIIISVVGWTGFILGEELESEIRALFITAGLIGTIMGLCFATSEWDLNPIHAIGYCLRFKERS